MNESRTTRPLCKTLDLDTPLTFWLSGDVGRWNSRWMAWSCCPSLQEKVPRIPMDFRIPCPFTSKFQLSTFLSQLYCSSPRQDECRLRSVNPCWTPDLVPYRLNFHALEVILSAATTLQLIGLRSQFSRTPGTNNIFPEKWKYHPVTYSLTHERSQNLR